METVSNLTSNLTSAASRAIWGTPTDNNDAGKDDASKENTEDPKTEPLSGETGDVKAGEPYDKGNLGKPFYIM